MRYKKTIAMTRQNAGNVELFFSKEPSFPSFAIERKMKKKNPSVKAGTSISAPCFIDGGSKNMKNGPRAVGAIKATVSQNGFIFLKTESAGSAGITAGVCADSFFFFVRGAASDASFAGSSATSDCGSERNFRSRAVL